MSEAMSDAMANLREHAPTLPSAKEAREAVKSHLPSIDVDAVRDHIPSLKDIDPSAITNRIPKPHGKRKVVAILGGLGAAAAVFGFARRRRTVERPTALYTPPMPPA